MVNRGGILRKIRISMSSSNAFAKGEQTYLIISLNDVHSKMTVNFMKINEMFCCEYCKYITRYHNLYLEITSESWYALVINKGV